MSTRILTVKQMAEAHPAFTETSLRWIIYKTKCKDDKKYNKFRSAFNRIGRRVYVDEEKFIEVSNWANQTN